MLTMGRPPVRSGGIRYAPQFVREVRRGRAGTVSLRERGCADVHHWAEEAVRKLPARCRVAVKGLTADSKAEVRMGERLAASVGLSGPQLWSAFPCSTPRANMTNSLRLNLWPYTTP
jgi:hypothetical protein